MTLSKSVLFLACLLYFIDTNHSQDVSSEDDVFLMSTTLGMDDDDNDSLSSDSMDLGMFSTLSVSGSSSDSGGSSDRADSLSGSDDGDDLSDDTSNSPSDSSDDSGAMNTEMPSDSSSLEATKVIPEPDSGSSSGSGSASGSGSGSGSVSGNNANNGLETDDSSNDSGPGDVSSDLDSSSGGSGDGVVVEEESDNMGIAANEMSSETSGAMSSESDEFASTMAADDSDSDSDSGSSSDDASFKTTVKTMGFSPESNRRNPDGQTGPLNAVANAFGDNGGESETSKWTAVSVACIIGVFFATAVLVGCWFFVTKKKSNNFKGEHIAVKDSEEDDEDSYGIEITAPGVRSETEEESEESESILHDEGYDEQVTLNVMDLDRV